MSQPNKTLLFCCFSVRWVCYSCQ